MFRLQLPKGVVKLDLIASGVLLHCLVAVLDEAMRWWDPAFRGAAVLRKLTLCLFLKKMLKGKEKNSNLSAE